MIASTREDSLENWPPIFLTLIEDIFSLFLEREVRREKEREKRNVNVREKHQLSASCIHPHRGLNPSRTSQGYPLILKYFCLGVICINPTNILLAKASHEATYIQRVSQEGDENYNIGLPQSSSPRS